MIFEPSLRLILVQVQPMSTWAVAYMREKRWDDALVELRKAQLLSPGAGYLLEYRSCAITEKMISPRPSNPLPPACSKRRNRCRRGTFSGCATFSPMSTSRPARPSRRCGRESNNPNYLYVLSIAAGKSSNVSLEKQAVDRMFAIGQNAPEFHLYIGKAWLAKGDTEKAVEEFNTRRGSPAEPAAGALLSGPRLS
jgi:hypothetical protein